MKYFNLSPSTDLNNQAYFVALNEKLNDKNVKNIAVIGPYGSGKSSVIDSFFKNNEKYNYLHVSLANFCENNFNKAIDKQPNDSDNQELKKQKSQEANLYIVDEQKIEEQILQQLFYQLDHSKIPFSGFKKIKHVDNKWQRKTLGFIIVWLFTLIFIPGIVLSLIENQKEISDRGFFEFWNLIYWPTTLFNIAIIGIFTWGLFYFLREVHNTIQKGQIKKITMKSALVELSEVSALNKHIDEIIYFFEATDKSILIIEDLDRFNSTALFSKLREVNFIINNSPKIIDKKVVKFIYAIKDDVFTWNLNRTKFFDFVLPVIPVINITNSGDQLRKMIDDEKLLGSSYINDISIYIHDMRLLKNIVNEFNLFNEVINQDNKKIRVVLFSIVLYKNLFPEEYCKEHMGEGLLKKVFTERKNEILQGVLKSYNEKLEVLKAERNTILNETAINEEKLREEYIVAILRSNPGVYEICDETMNTIIQEEAMFEKLLKNTKLSYYGINVGPRSQNLRFDEIQRKVNPEKTYKDRLKILKLRNEGKADELISEINKAGKTISEIKRKKLSALVKLNKDNSWKAKIFQNTGGKLSPEQDLLLLLLRKGYINESYPLYISYFYDGALTLKDFEFLLNVKKNEGENFHTKLFNIDELLERIDEDEYEFEATLNIYLIIALLNKSDYSSDVRLELMLRQLQKLENVFDKIIVPLIELLKGSQKILQRLLELLVIKYFPTIWDAIEKQNFDEETKEEYLKMFLFLSEENIQVLNNSSGDESFKKYLAAKSNLMEIFVSEPEKKGVIKTVKALSLKFHNLAFKRLEDNPIFIHIYQNNNYELNYRMLYLMLFNKYSMSEQDFKELFNAKNYTCLFEADSVLIFSYVTENIETYIDDIYLQFESKQQESEDALLSFLENIDGLGDKELFSKVLGKVSIKIQDLEKFGRNDLWSFLLETDCIYPSWDNLQYSFAYFDGLIGNGLVEWLNKKTVFEKLSRIKLRVDNFSEEKKKVINSLMNQIIECGGLSNEAFMSLIHSFPYTFPNVNLVDELSQEKVSILIDHRKIIFNVAHYDQLLSLNFILELLRFTENNINYFLDNYSDFEYSDELNTGLLASKLLSIRFKRRLAKSIPLENISNAKIALLVSNVLLKTKPLIVDNNKLVKVISYCPKQNKKLHLLNNYLKRLSFSEITEILKFIGDEYKDASFLRGRPKWENNEVNLSIAQKLDNYGFFSSVSIDEVNEQIRIIVRYS